MPKAWRGLPFLVLFVLDAAAAEEDLVTDRPDQTESPMVVPRHAFQVETGVTLERDDDTEVLGVPGTLVRFGVSPRFEVRLAWPGWGSIDTGSEDVDGLADPEIGMKLKLSSKRAVALLAHVSLPVGDDDVGSPEATPSIRLSAAHDFTERV